MARPLRTEFRAAGHHGTSGGDRRKPSRSAQRDFTAQCGLPPEEFYADSFTSEADKHGAAG